MTVIPRSTGAEQQRPGQRRVVVGIEDLLTRAVTADAAQRARIHSEVVARSLDLARALAHRYRDRGEPLDDLIQVANTGLVLAVQRFQPGLGARFTSYATPTILGELRRYFRDQTWAIRPPRRVQEALPRIRAAVAELAQTTKAQPSIADVAEHLELSEAEVASIETAARHYNLVSLDGYPSDEHHPAHQLQPAVVDSDLEAVLTRMTVDAVLAPLTDRERTIIRLRYLDGWTQQQIADRIGVSQMQVSRLLKSILHRLRERAAELDEPLLSA